MKMLVQLDILDKTVLKNAKVLVKAVTMLLVYAMQAVSLDGSGTSVSKNVKKGNTETNVFLTVGAAETRRNAIMWTEHVYMGVNQDTA